MLLRPLESCTWHSSCREPWRTFIAGPAQHELRNAGNLVALAPSFSVRRATQANRKSADGIRGPHLTRHLQILWKRQSERQHGVHHCGLSVSATSMIRQLFVFRNLSSLSLSGRISWPCPTAAVAVAHLTYNLLQGYGQRPNCRAGFQSNESLVLRKSHLRSPLSGNTSRQLLSGPFVAPRWSTALTALTNESPQPGSCR